MGGDNPGAGRWLADLTGDHNFLHVDVVAECLVRFYA